MRKFNAQAPAGKPEKENLIRFRSDSPKSGLVGLAVLVFVSDVLMEVSAGRWVGAQLRFVLRGNVVVLVDGTRMELYLECPAGWIVADRF